MYEMFSTVKPAFVMPQFVDLRVFLNQSQCLTRILADYKNLSVEGTTSKELIRGDRKYRIFEKGRPKLSASQEGYKDVTIR